MSKLLPDSSKLKKAAVSNALLGGLNYLISLISIEDSKEETVQKVEEKLAAEKRNLEDKISLLLVELKELVDIVADETKTLIAGKRNHSSALVTRVTQAKVKLEQVLAALRDKRSIQDKDLANAVKEAKKAIVAAKKFLLKADHNNNL